MQYVHYSKTGKWQLPEADTTIKVQQRCPPQKEVIPDDDAFLGSTPVVARSSPMNFHTGNEALPSTNQMTIREFLRAGTSF